MAIPTQPAPQEKQRISKPTDKNRDQTTDDVVVQNQPTRIYSILQKKQDNSTASTKHLERTSTQPTSEKYKTYPSFTMASNTQLVQQQSYRRCLRLYNNRKAYL